MSMPRVLYVTPHVVEKFSCADEIGYHALDYTDGSEAPYLCKATVLEMLEDMKNITGVFDELTIGTLIRKIKEMG